MYIIRMRRGTQSQWAADNPTLSEGEPGFVTDTNQFKIGDGTTAWSALPFAEGTQILEGDSSSPPAELNDGAFLYDPDAEPDPSLTPITQDLADARYVNADGGTMTGRLDINVGASLAQRILGGGSLQVFSPAAKSVQFASLDTQPLRIRDANAPRNVVSYFDAGDGTLSLMPDEGAVVVPAPTAATHAAQKQDVDAKVSKSGDTMTGTLKVQGTDGGTKIIEFTGTSDGRQSDLINVNDLYIALRQFDGPVVKSQLRLHTDGTATLIAAGGFTVPAPTAADHAAQVTAIDPATGRLAIGGLEMGDTGWRDVSADLLNGWTGTLHIKRRGTGVLVRGWSLNASAASAGSFYTLPLGGFRVMSSSYQGLFFSSAGTPIVGRISSTYSCNVIGAYAGITNGAFSWDLQTPDSWPDTLPGTAV